MARIASIFQIRWADTAVMKTLCSRKKSKGKAKGTVVTKLLKPIQRGGDDKARRNASGALTLS